MDEQPLISIIMAIRNSNLEYLTEALDSCANQTLPSELYEIILVDDYSDDPLVIDFLNALGKEYNYKGISLELIKLQKNQWLAEARNIGVEQCNAPFVTFLDDDDKIDTNFLKSLLLSLLSSTGTSWSYPNKVKFGQYASGVDSVNFHPFKFTFQNHTPYASLFEKEAWLTVKQRDIKVVKEKRIFEDWDSIIRLIGKNKFGVCVNQTNFHYRKGTHGLAARSPLEYAASVYVMWRTNILNILKSPLTLFRYNRFIRKGFGLRHPLNPNRILDTLVHFFVSRYTNLPYHKGVINFSMLTLSLLKPHQFVNKLLQGELTITPAQLRAGFHQKPDLDFTEFFTNSENCSVTVLCANTWWSLGGAENIYLEWIKQFRPIGVQRLINIVELGQSDNRLLFDKFTEVCDEQFALDQLTIAPLYKARACWNLICLEKPKLIFISGNSYFYLLAEKIKEHFPEIRIIDILHNEFEHTIDHFDASREASDFIDHRIVTSDYWKDVLVKKYDIDSHDISVCRNPVDMDRFNPSEFDKTVLREEIDINLDKKVISFIGRLHPQKNPQQIIELAKIMQDKPEFHFLIVGDGELYNSIKSQAKMYKNITFVGYSASVESYMALSDILFCPSVYEGNPLISVEAAAMNLPIIATETVGFKEQVDEGHIGVLYQPTNDLIENAYIIKRILINDYDSILELGQNGRPYVKEHHDLKLVSKHYQQVLSSQLI